jgi:hypothetical protein
MRLLVRQSYPPRTQPVRRLSVVCVVGSLFGTTTVVAAAGSRRGGSGSYVGGCVLRHPGAGGSCGACG